MRTKYFLAGCLDNKQFDNFEFWRIKNGKVLWFSISEKTWRKSVFSNELLLTKNNAFSQVSRDCIRKLFPEAFRKTAPTA